MNRQIQHYLESYPVEETISIVRRESCHQGHKETGVCWRNWCAVLRQLWPIIQAPLLRRTPQQRRRTSIASRRRTHLHCVTKERLLPTYLRCVTKNNAPPLRHEERRTSIASRRIDAPPLRHETTHLRCVTKRSVRTYKRNGVCTSIATPRTRTPGS